MWVCHLYVTPGDKGDRVEHTLIQERESNKEWRKLRNEEFNSMYFFHQILLELSNQGRNEQNT